MSFVGYMILSVVFSAWIYPVIIHWAFGNGWLMQMGYHDFAGSGAIHLTGAMGALAVTWLLKPRKNRFNPQYEAEFQPCNTPYITLATLSVSLKIYLNYFSSYGSAGCSSIPDRQRLFQGIVYIIFQTLE
jgi:Amt family ammonium transporter